MIFSAYWILLAGVASIEGASVVPALLTTSESQLKLEQLTMPNDFKVPVFQPSNQEPYDPTIMNEIKTFLTTRKKTAQIRNEFFVRNNEPQWSKLIPAARDHVQKPAGMHWSYLKDQLDYAISMAEIYAGEKEIKKRLLIVDADWQDFLTERKQLLAKKPTGILFKKLSYTPTEVATLEHKYSVYKNSHAYVKKLIRELPDNLIHLSKLKYVRQWFQ